MAWTHGSRVVIITSNKFMTTAAGGKLRRLITEASTPLRIIDFRDASPFRAAVLASILVLEKRPAQTPKTTVVRLSRHRRTTNGEAAIRTLGDELPPPHVMVPRLGAQPVAADVDVYTMTSWRPSSRPWHLNGDGGDHALQLLTFATEKLSTMLPRLSVGIKTTADDVFIAPFGEQPPDVEPELLHPLLRGKSIRPWTTAWDLTNGYDRQVLYPHREESGRTVPVDLDRYPLARQYLESRRQRLEERT